MNSATIMSILLIVGSLILVGRGMRGHQIAPGKRVQMAVIWLVIIIGIVFVIDQAGI